MFGFGKKKEQQNTVAIPQSEVDASGRGYEDIINDFAQIDGTPLNRFVYNRGYFNTSDASFVFYYYAEEEMVPEEAAILEEAFMIMGKGSSVVKVNITAPDEIELDVRVV